MKLTRPESIQESEKTFIDTIRAELDWHAIEQMLCDKENFRIQDNIEYRDGNLIVYNNEIAYKFDFEIRIPLSVIFNRGGECLSLSTHREDAICEESNDGQCQASSPIQAADGESKREKEQGLAVEIAGLISEINSKR